MAGSYSLYDFKETITALGNDADKVTHCLAAWGVAGIYAEWKGGFLVQLTGKGFAYITGWCDTTGWGCQDGVDVRRFTKKPKLADLQGSTEWDPCLDPKDWDVAPADVNRWIANGMKEKA